jgi:hypothetical protein
MSFLVISVIVILGLAILALTTAAAINYYTAEQLSSGSVERTLKVVAIFQIIGILLLIVGTVFVVIGVWAPLTQKATAFMGSDEGQTKIKGGLGAASRYNKGGLKAVLAKAD